jgi:RimJ/RimL family protein N-acetyltransferase
MANSTDRLDIPTLETERLRLRPFRKSDIDDYAALNADPEVQRYVSDGAVWDRGRSWRHLAFLMGHWYLGGTGTWAVEDRETGEFVGKIGFSCPEGWPGFELAWALVRGRWGRGYATEGARAALQYAFDELRQGHVISLIRPINGASIRVAERLGESLEGTARVAGVEYLVYGLDRSHYSALAA